MLSLTHHDVTVILFALATLLLSARLFGEIATRLRQPAIIGEIVAGIVLGPTVLGRIAPDLMEAIFPASGNPQVVLEGIATIAVVLFLLVAGMEVDLSSMFRQGKAAMSVSVAGIFVPFIVGLVTALALPDVLERPSHVDLGLFALLFATAMAISALPVVAKTLIDLNLFRTDLGMVVIAAAIFDDLVGWVIFALVIGMIDPGQRGGMGIGATIALTLLFVVFMLTAGRWAIHALLPWVQARLAWPASVLAFAMSLGMIAAAITEFIGVHAVFGSFIAGVALGDSPHLRERTRATINQFVSFVFAPLFFASIGLRVDFIAHFEIVSVLVVLGVAMVGKIVGCGFGARVAGMSWRESWAVGFGMNARGAMGIILGVLALQYGVISHSLFVALVIMALATSIMSGSVMQALLRRPTVRQFADHLHPRGFINPLKSTSREDAITELARTASTIVNLPADAIAAAALQRERMMPTGLGLCVAVPHARLHGLSKPLVCLGMSRDGIEFNAPDGESSRMIFLILTPADDDGAQLEILADISRTFLDAALREAALRVGTYNEFVALLRTREPAAPMHRHLGGSPGG